MKSKSYLIVCVALLLYGCSKSDSAPLNSTGATGTSGSLARFALVGDYLYTVTNSDLKVFDVANEANPIFQKDIPLGIGIETIFPLGNTLFLGSQNGMYIFDIANPLSPNRQSLYTHITSCDPVVANDQFAYVTLSTEATRCARGLNQLEIIDITDKKAPKLLKTYPMTRPQGLAISGNDLFICDDQVKWYDTANSPTILQKGTINVKAHDVIIVGKTLLLVGERGLSQYDFSGTTPRLLSEIGIGK